MKSRNIFSVVLALGFVLSAFPVNAQEAAGLETGESEILGFSRIIRNPAKSAKGYAGIAHPDDIAWSSFENSAIIPFSERKFDIGLMYQNWAPKGMKSNNFGLGAAYRIGEKFGCSLGFLMQKGASYEMLDENGTVIGEEKPSDLQINLGFAYKIGEVVSIGLNAKYLNSKLNSSDSYTGFATDLFAQCRLSDFSFAAGMSNLGPSVKDQAGNGFKQPTSVTLGADYLLRMGEMHQLDFVADLDYFLAGNVSVGLGVEYDFNDLVYVRTGYHYGSKKCVLPSFATAGLGVHFFGVKIDFSYLFADPMIGNTMTVGLGYSF